MSLPLSSRVVVPVHHTVDRVPWADLGGVRVGLVLWGGLAVLDVCRLAGTPAYAAPVAVALLVTAASLHTRTGTALGNALVGWLLVDGFVEHRWGVLGFDAGPDLAALATLTVLAVLATRAHR